jgi:hypothetical protein
LVFISNKRQRIKKRRRWLLLTSVKEVSFFLHIKKSEIKVTDKEQKKWNEKLEDLLIKVEKEVAGHAPRVPLLDRSDRPKA